MKLAYLRTDDFSFITEPRGGSFSHVDGFVQSLRRLGHEVFFIASAPPAPSAGKDIPLTVVDHPRFFEVLPELNRIMFNISFIRKAMPILRMERPDALYQRHSDFTVSGVILSRLLSVPLILEVNASEVWHQANWGKLTLKRLCALCEDISFSGARAIIVVSDVLKRQLVELGAKEGKIIVNPNGVDPNFFHPNVSSQSIKERFGLHGKIVIGFLGTFGPWHGADILARAAGAVSRKEPLARFLFIGHGPLRNDVENILKESRVPDRAIFVGSVPHEEVPQYLAACDILVSPHVPLAQGTEFFGSPTKLFEYMAMGKPIVASRLGQIAEVLRHEETALLVQPGDPEDLVQGILRLLKNQKLGEALGKKAREIVEKNYTWEANVRCVLKLIERLT